MLSEKIRNRVIFKWFQSIEKIGCLISNKIYQIHIHGSDLESFHKFLDPRILPDFLGGDNDSWKADRDIFIKGMMAKEQHYEGIPH